MPATISSCFSCWGLWGSAYTVPGCRRLGTMKSRAPSGVLLIRFGVSTSMNWFAWWTSRIAWTRRLRRSSRRCIASRRMSRYR